MPEIMSAKSRPRFSIVIPTYNTVDVLERCVQALADQNGDKEGIEIIIVNDGGDGREPRAVSVLRDRIRIRYYVQDHQGPAAARNFGIEKAQGDIILFLDDDSMPVSNWLEATIKAWGKFPDADGIGGCVASDANDSIFCRVNADFFNWYLRQRSADPASVFLSTCNAGYKKTSLDRVGRFDDRFKRASGEDRDLNIRLLKQGGSLILDESVIVYHDRDLTLRSFARKNFNYGKAAYRIYARYPEQKLMSSRGYAALFQLILKEYAQFSQRVLAFCLLALSQIATAFGYYSAVLSASKSGARQIADA